MSLFVLNANEESSFYKYVNVRAFKFSYGNAGESKGWVKILGVENIITKLIYKNIL